MPRHSACLSTILLACMALLLPSLSRADVCPLQPVRIGYEPWLPYTYQADDGSFTGLDLDVISRVLSRLGCQYEFIERPWKRLLMELETGDLHLTGGASFTSEREMWGVFSVPYRDERVELLVRKGVLGRFGSVDSLHTFLENGFSLGHTRDYFYGDEFEQVSRLPEFYHLVQPGGDDLANLHKLEHQRMDGFLTDPYSAAAAIRTHGLDLQVTPLLTVFRSDIHVLFSRRSVDPQLIAAFNLQLRAMLDSGELQQLINRYLNEE
jgi:polar amino acid transport system substrate-binding protein